MISLDPNKVRFFYLRDKNKFPVACVASTTFTTASGSYVAFAVSTHNPHDRYCRDCGKQLAKARLIDQECMLTEAGPGAHTRISQRIADNKCQPIRTREAAADWLRQKSVG